MNCFWNIVPPKDWDATQSTSLKVHFQLWLSCLGFWESISLQVLMLVPAQDSSIWECKKKHTHVYRYRKILGSSGFHTYDRQNHSTISFRMDDTLFSGNDPVAGISVWEREREIYIYIYIYYFKFIYSVSFISWAPCDQKFGAVYFTRGSKCWHRPQTDR